MGRGPESASQVSGMRARMKRTPGQTRRPAGRGWMISLAGSELVREWCGSTSARSALRGAVRGLKRRQRT